MIDGRLGTFRLLYDTVNRILRQHNDAVYYSLAIRAVAQQIDRLYWDFSEPKSTAHNRGFDEDSELHQTDDLTHDEYVLSLPFKCWKMLTSSSIIAILPHTWSDSLEYAALLERLQTLSSHRAELRKKLKLYRQLQAMTAPFRNPQTAVQPNLISRDGPLTKEMEKTRSLGIRVAGGLVGRNKGAGSDDPTNTGQ
jgi:hypothetical protein